MKSINYLSLLPVLLSSTFSAKNFENFSPNKKLPVQASISKKVTLQNSSKNDKLFQIRDVRPEIVQEDMKIRAHVINDLLLHVFKETMEILKVKKVCRITVSLASDGGWVVRV